MGMLFNELTAGFYLLTHERVEDVVSQNGIIDLQLENRTLSDPWSYPRADPRSFHLSPCNAGWCAAASHSIQNLLQLLIIKGII